jgi:hypothetical protein
MGSDETMETDSQTVNIDSKIGEEKMDQTTDGSPVS